MSELINKRYEAVLIKIADKRERSLNDIKKATNLDIARASTIMRLWCQLGLIDKEQYGRELKIKITDKGIEVLKLLKKIDNLLKAKEEIKQEEKENGE